MDRLDCERLMSKKLARRGWEMVGYEEYLGTNFDSPDERQVFERFFTSGLKYRGDVISRLLNDLNNLLIKTGNSLYHLAIRAIEFAGKRHGMYPGSQNINFEREMYEEFKNDFV